MARICTEKVICYISIPYWLIWHFQILRSYLLIGEFCNLSVFFFFLVNIPFFLSLFLQFFFFFLLSKAKKVARRYFWVCNLCMEWNGNTAWSGSWVFSLLFKTSIYLPFPLPLESKMGNILPCNSFPHLNNNNNNNKDYNLYYLFNLQGVTWTTFCLF